MPLPRTNLIPFPIPMLQLSLHPSSLMHNHNVLPRHTLSFRTYYVCRVRVSASLAWWEYERGGGDWVGGGVK